MKVARIHRQGEAGVLAYEEVPKPLPGPGEILVWNVAAGVNFADIERRRGGYYPVPISLPFIPGTEFAGEVEAVGGDVTSFQAGDRVFGLVNPVQASCYAQYVVAGERDVFPPAPGPGAGGQYRAAGAGTDGVLPPA